MNKKEIDKIFQSFNRLKVLVIGDVMVDSYVWGKVTRISPEAPVPVVAVHKKENRLGGAANVALNVQAMGAAPILCSIVGKDDGGELFIELLKNQKLSSQGILKSAKRATTLKTRVIGNNHQLIRVDEEIDSNVSPNETSELYNTIEKIIKSEKIDAIIFEDYDKGLITPVLIEKVVRLANDKNIPTVVDPKKKNFLSYKGVTVLKPNLKEFKEGIKNDFDHSNIKELDKEVDAFIKKQEIDTVFITLSEHGVYINTQKFKKRIPAYVRQIADVSGAGDTVVSLVALCIALKVNPYIIASIANLAGGLVCEQVGVVPINKQQLLNEAFKINL